MEERQRSGMTQVALSQQLACPQSVISKVECGERRLDFVEFIDWANALSFDVSSFVERFRARLAMSPHLHRQPPPA